MARTDPPFTILDAGLPATIKAGREWETAIRDSDLPYAAQGTDITGLVRVRLSGDIELTASPRENVPPAGVIPRG